MAAMTSEQGLNEVRERSPFPNNPWRKMEEAKRQRLEEAAATPTTPLLPKTVHIPLGYKRMPNDDGEKLHDEMAAPTESMEVSMSGIASLLRREMQPMTIAMNELTHNFRELDTKFGDFSKLVWRNVCSNWKFIWGVPKCESTSWRNFITSYIQCRKACMKQSVKRWSRCHFGSSHFGSRGSRLKLWGIGGRGIIAPPWPSCMRKVLLDLGGVRVEGVVERDFLLLLVAAVLAAGGSLQAVPLEAADPEPDPPAAQVPPPPPAPRRARAAAAPRHVFRPAAKPPARPRAKVDPKPKRTA